MLSDRDAGVGIGVGIVAVCGVGLYSSAGSFQTSTSWKQINSVAVSKAQEAVRVSEVPSFMIKTRVARYRVNLEVPFCHTRGLFRTV